MVDFRTLSFRLICQKTRLPLHKAPPHVTFPTTFHKCWKMLPISSRNKCFNKRVQRFLLQGEGFNSQKHKVKSFWINLLEVFSSTAFKQSPSTQVWTVTESKSQRYHWTSCWSRISKSRAWAFVGKPASLAGIKIPVLTQLTWQLFIRSKVFRLVSTFKLDHSSVTT